MRRSGVRLSAEEREIQAGEHGEAARWAIEYQLDVGRFFGAERLVAVRSAHVHCDGEALGEPGVAFLERWAEAGARVRIPLTLDPRSTDGPRAREIGQDQAIVDSEARIVAALREMGAIPTNTCINYQTVDVPHFGEHLAWGDTGSVIYANSVAGARSNFEGGPAALAAALTGRTPDYGFHLDSQRRGTLLVRVRDRLRGSSDWGALGCLVGRASPGYWEVPVFDRPAESPTPDELKHLGAALASYGSHALFHMVGVTPEARTREEAFAGAVPERELVVRPGELALQYASFPAERSRPDLIVFGTPQLSVFEFKEIAEGLAGSRVRTTVYLTTSAQVKAAADEYGYGELVRASGAVVLTGVCFYLMTARELARRNGYRTLLTNSAKLANTIAGYGYNPVFRSTEDCLKAAVTGSIDR
jgi:predicted aconitase